jgi:hypothetical protein
LKAESSKPKRTRGPGKQKRTAETVATADTPNLPAVDANAAGSTDPVACSSLPGSSFSAAIRAATTVDSLKASSVILRELWDQWTHAAEVTKANEDTEDTARLKVLMAGRDRIGETLVQALANHVRIQERHGELQALGAKQAGTGGAAKVQNTFSVDNVFVQMQGLTGEPVQKFLPDLRRNLERLMTRTDKQAERDLRRDNEDDE